MKILNNVTFHQRILLYVMFICVIALVQAGVSIGLFELKSFRESLLSQRLTVSQIIATNVASAVAFEDRNYAANILRGLSVAPDIEVVCIYNNQGSLFASYINPQTVGENCPVFPVSRTETDIRMNNFSLVNLISFEGEGVGFLYLKSDLGELYSHLWEVAIAILVCAAFSLALAYLLSTKVMRQFTQSVDELSRVAKKVTREQDYSVRATKFADDEFGELTEIINEMLLQIGQRDKSLGESEARFRRLFENAPVGLEIVDSTGTCANMNQAMIEMLGGSGSERFDNHNVFEDPRFSAEFKKHLRDGASFSDDGWVNLKEPGYFGHKLPTSQSKVYYQFRVLPLTLSLQSDSEYLIVAQDLTRRKQIEAESVRLESQLRQAQKMEAVGQLTGGIAHDFNNILAIILGYSQLGIKHSNKEDGGKLGQCLEEIKNAAERGRDLIVHMLDFSRPQIGDSGQAKGQVEVSSVVSGTVSLLRATIPMSIELKTDFADNIGWVKIDAVQLQQIVMNLCINAKDALDGHGQIVIGLRYVRRMAVDCASCHKTTTADYLELSVRDSGPGINPEIKQRLFEPFFTTKDVGEGTGMGLSVVHGIVHEHNGHIVVDSELGLGTVFKVLIPPTTDVIEESVPAHPETRSVKPYKRSGNILLIDDEEMVASFMTELMEGWGYRVTSFTDSRKALENFRMMSDKYCAVVIDQTMPGLSGVELGRVMLDITPDLPIILCTGYSDKVNETNWEHVGLKGFLTKPIDTDRLFDLLAKV